MSNLNADAAAFKPSGTNSSLPGALSAQLKLSSQSPEFVPSSVPVVYQTVPMPYTVVQPPLPATPPEPVVTPELREKIVAQVEFYFSDRNLPTDKFLLKNVRKNPEGWVQIGLLASFNKVKMLTKDARVLASALRHSEQLQVDAKGYRVKRKVPLPEVDLSEVYSRTVVVENLPNDQPTIEEVQVLMSKVGTVKLVRICKPSSAEVSVSSNPKAEETHSKADTEEGSSSMEVILPAGQAPRGKGIYVSLQIHALVEYSTVAEAKRAIEELSQTSQTNNWRKQGLRVKPLLMKPFHHVNVEKNVEEGEHAADNGDKEVDGTDSASRNRQKKKKGKKVQGAAENGSAPANTVTAVVHVEPPKGPRMPDGTRGFALGRGGGKVATGSSPGIGAPVEAATPAETKADSGIGAPPEGKAESVAATEKRDCDRVDASSSNTSSAANTEGDACKLDELKGGKASGEKDGEKNGSVTTSS